MSGDKSNNSNQDLASDPLFVHPADTNILSLVTTPFDGDGYLSWKRSMLIALSAKNKIGFITGDVVRPTTDATKIRMWDRCNDMVISWILGSVSEEIKASVIYTDTAKEIWEELEERFEQYNGAKLYQLQDNLNQISQGSTSISVYFTKLKKSWEEIRNVWSMPKCKCGCTCGAYKAITKHEEDQKIIKFLMGLNDSYKTVRGNILMMEPIPNINGVYSLLIQEERKREISPQSDLNLEASSMAARGWNNANKNYGNNFRNDNNSGNGNPRNKNLNSKNEVPCRRNNYHCTHCNVDGHSDSRCYILHPELRRNRRMGTAATANTESERGESFNTGSMTEYEQILQDLSKFNLRPSTSGLAMMAGEKVRDTGSSTGSVVSEIAESGEIMNVSSTIKILSYNVWFRDELEGHLRMQAIGNLIQLHSPDVICFQEVNSILYDIFQRSSWWKKYRCSVSFERSQNEAYFCMQLAKIPVKSFSCKPFSYTMMRRELCITQLELNNNKSLVITTSHLESPCPRPPTWDQMFSKERVNQAKEAITFLQQFPNVIFCGDMNWDDKRDGRFPFTEGWFDAWEKLRPAEVGYTYDTKSNRMLSGNYPLQKRLDRFVCHLPDFKVSQIEMIGTEAILGLEYKKEKKMRGKIQEITLPVYPSDHYGLLLTVTN